MNTLIIRDRLDKSDVNFNDDYFDYNMDRYGSENEILLKDAIQSIDECEYSGNCGFNSRFMGETSINRLSTGCKTAVNVLANRNEIFNICGCGGNAVDFILRYADIIVSTTSWVPISNWRNPLKLVYNGVEYAVNSKAEYTNWWQDVYDKAVED